MNGYIPFGVWGEAGKAYILDYLARTGGSIRIGRHVGDVAYVGHYGLSVIWQKVA